MGDFIILQSLYGTDNLKTLEAVHTVGEIMKEHPASWEKMVVIHCCYLGRLVQ